MSGIVFHIFHRPERGKTLSVDLPEGHRAFFYGQALGGRACINAILHDPPRDAYDQQWLDEVLHCRLAPGATVADLDAREAQAREAVEQ